MRTQFYTLDLWILFVTAVVVLFLSTELGVRLGRRSVLQMSSEVSANISTIEGALLGLLALMLGFAFAMAINRFDARVQVVIDEAADVRTAYLRTQLLPAPYREETRQLLFEFIQARVAFSRSGATAREMNDANARTRQLLRRLWALSVAAARSDPEEVTTGYLAASLNDLIEDHGRRTIAMSLHVPEIILHLLFFVATVTLGVAGYGTGLRRTRMPALRAVLAVLVASILTVIVDLDRPHEGLIRVGEVSARAVQRDLPDFLLQK